MRRNLSSSPIAHGSRLGVEISPNTSLRNMQSLSASRTDGALYVLVAAGLLAIASMRHDS
jgi:hypothetical protein